MNRKRNQRGFYTKKAIKETYAKMCCEYKRGQITVKNLCKEIPISRNTFYLYYDDISGVLDEIENELIEGFLTIYDDFPDSDYSQYNKGDIIPVFMDTLFFIKLNKIYFSAVLGKNLDYCFIERWKKIIKKSFKTRWKNQGVIYENEALVLETISMGAISSFSYWLEHENDVNIVEMCKFLGGKMFFEPLTSSNNSSNLP